MEKCFLCEKFVGKKGIVEHFLPWHKEFPERAYEWENLNLSCNECNDRKRQKPYRIPADPHKPAMKTVLINPSKPSFGYTVEELIRFNKHREAVAGGKKSVSSEVVNTIKFLNDTKPLRYRNRRWDELTEIVFQSDCKTIWWEFRDMRAINPNDWDDAEFSGKISALERGDAVYQMFLTERSPFYACMKYVVFEILRLSVADFKQMSDTYRKYKGLATD
ncbi:HNH endonuclease signature motif containing protein [Desulfobacterales bacterium HSG2]|nr:HNH endonuclease signature motif containing protein [Desulfobacterales bacterium HSG2]